MKVILIVFMGFSGYLCAQSTRTGEQPYQYNRKVPLPSLSAKGKKQEVKEVKQSAVTLSMVDSTLVFMLDGVAVHTLKNYGYYSNNGKRFYYTPTQRLEPGLGCYFYEDKTTFIVYKLTFD